MKQRVLLLTAVIVAVFTQSYAQGFRIYKDGAVIGTYGSERFDRYLLTTKTIISRSTQSLMD